MAEEQDHDGLIAELTNVTGLGPDEARSYLEMAEWDLNFAATSYFAANHPSTETEEEPEAEPYTGPRTLDGRPAPQAIPSVGSGPSSTSRLRGSVATLGSIGGNSHAGHGHGEEEEDDDSNGEEPRDLFAGGEKSGLAVQDPKRDPKALIQDIIDKAKANTSPNPRSQPAPATSSRFRGAGTTLGGEDAPSRIVPDPEAGRQQPAPVVTRILHIWEEGFSIDDGDLRRFDDPRHAQDLEMIRQGRAPLHLMGVSPGQPVEVELKKHNEKYQKPKTIWKPFSGSGQRLGSPTPGESSTSTAAAPTPTPTTTSTPQVNIDSSQPTVSLRLQLMDGTRLATRFNTSQTIGDVYEFINRASPGSSSIPWVLATTFPTMEHTDMLAVLGDMAEFKKGGTAVQKRLGGL